MKEDFRWKWIDDHTLLDIINLLNIGISSYNTKLHVPNDLDINKYFIPPSNLETNNHLRSISDWTEKQKMLLNTKKTTNMTINFTDNYQFSTRLYIKGEKINTVETTKLLGTTITNSFKWDENTKELVKKANARMCLLRKVASFKPSRQDLRLIYIQYVRSILEQFCVVWHSSLTLENSLDIERIQKNSLRIILQNKYNNYEEALEKLNLETLEQRRETLCLKFARKCHENSQTNDIFY